MLTRSLNYRSLAEMCDTMDNAEYCLWAAEFERNPWDEQRDDLRAGEICAAITNMAGKTQKEHAPPAAPIDYMRYARPKPEETQPGADDLTQFIGGFYPNDD